MELPQRILSKIDQDGPYPGAPFRPVPGPCWIWTAGKDRHGYGRVGFGTREQGHGLAHRFVYDLLVGPIPAGLVIDHVCRVTSCVNPAHLEPVTQAENMRRGYFGQKTHCPKGHEYTSENIRPTKNGRSCRECARADVRARRERKRIEEGRPKGKPARTHCSRGHELTVENTTTFPSSGPFRHCRECLRFRAKRRHARNMAKRQEADGPVHPAD